MKNAICTALLFATCLSLCGCAERHPHPGAITPPPPLQPPQDGYISNLTAQAYGTVSVNGGVTRGGNSYNSANSSNAPNAAVALGGSTNGDEDAVSCGGPEYHRDSESLASAQFNPQNDSNTRTYGFGLNVATQAKGGYWKQHVMLLSCGHGSDTDGSATAEARGEIRLNFNGVGKATDQLIVRVTGNTKPTITVLDVGNNTLPLSDLAGGVGQVVTLPSPGPYTVVGEISDQSHAHAHDDTSDNKSAAISIQSMRDALALGYGSAVNEEFKIPLPVIVSAADIEAELKKELFSPKNGSGKLYPCKDRDDCKDTSWIYLENPHVEVNGGWVTLSLHVGGGVGLFGMLGINGDILLYGVPTVRDNVLTIDGLSLEGKSHNWLFGLAQSLGAEKRILALITPHAKYDLKPKLGDAMDQIEKHFPVQWGGACLLVNPKSIDLEGLYTRPEEHNVEAEFVLGLTIGDLNACGTEGIVKELSSILDQLKTLEVIKPVEPLKR